MTRQEKTTITANDSGRKVEIAEAVGNTLSSIIAYCERLDIKNALYLAARTITVGYESKTLVAAVYYRPPIVKDVSSTLIPNPRQDATQHSLAILNHYAKNFPNVDSIYFTLDGLGHVLSADNGVRTEKLFLQANPIEPLLEEKMAEIMNNLRHNRGL